MGIHSSLRYGSSAPYTVVRLTLGVVLLAAAALKGYQLATEPTADTRLMDSWWFVVSAVEFEFLLAACLLVGIYPQQIRRIATGCFALFACVSAYKVVTGESSCGCFGSVELNPWFSLILDLVAVLALLHWRPTISRAIDSDPARHAVSPVGTILAFWLAIGIPTAWGAVMIETAQVDANGDILGDGDTVVLKPEEWSGRALPILRYVSIDADLAHGEWLVLLYDLDCSACREALPLFQQLAEEFAGNPRAPSIALIECPSLKETGGTGTSCSQGVLSTDRDWRLPAPAVLLINAGVVRTVFGNARDLDLFREIWAPSESNPSHAAAEGLESEVSLGR